MAKKNALGKGLSALLENVETDITSGNNSRKSAGILGSVAMLPLTQIELNPFQPRTAFDEQAMVELAQSIRELGIIQPVTVRKMGYDQFQLISGERRFRASKMAGLTELPAYIRVANDQAMLEMALVENIQRKNLDAIEIAISYQRLIDECRLTHDGLSKRVGKNRTTISNYLRLLRLPPEIQKAIRTGVITMGHARALLALDSDKAMIEALKKIEDEGWSVRQVERLGRDIDNLRSNEKSVAAPLSFAHQKIKADLMDLFGTKVDLRRDSSGKGKIEILFQSENELQRIMDRLEL